MNIAVIGARRTNNGIGEYIGKYFHLADARVVCVLGTTDESAREASEALSRYGISARPYRHFSKMLESEDLDAVAIASPAHTHFDYIVSSIENNLDVFCEKPFLDPEDTNIPEKLETVSRLSSEKGITLAMNSQWPFCLSSYEQLCGRVDPSAARSFSIRLSPICNGREMIPDSVPHCLSILYAALGEGKITGLSFDETAESMTIGFTYVSGSGGCGVSLSLVQEKMQPRKMSFGFNGRIARRTIDMTSYSISLVSGDNEVIIPDPLELSVKDFVASCESERDPMIGRRHIVATSLMLKQIYDAYTYEKRK